MKLNSISAEIVKRRVVLPALLLLAFAVMAYETYAAGTTNVSVLYGWNGSEFAPVQIDQEGALKTTLNLSESFGMTPYNDAVYDIGTSARRWNTGYFMSM